MPKYLVQACYTVEGLGGVLKDGGTRRKQAIAQALEGVGGKLEALYFAFGDTDAYLIADVPDNITAAAVALTTGSTGTVKVKTTVLLTPEEIDAAATKTMDYRPPGH